MAAIVLTVNVVMQLTLSMVYLHVT